jgi:hypothetical protein
MAQSITGCVTGHGNKIKGLVIGARPGSVHNVHSDPSYRLATFEELSHRRDDGRYTVPRPGFQVYVAKNGSSKAKVAVKWETMIVSAREYEELKQQHQHA